MLCSSGSSAFDQLCDLDDITHLVQGSLTVLICKLRCDGGCGGASRVLRICSAAAFNAHMGVASNWLPNLFLNDSRESRALCHHEVCCAVGWCGLEPVGGLQEG